MSQKARVHRELSSEGRKKALLMGALEEFPKL